MVVCEAGQGIVQRFGTQCISRRIASKPNGRRYASIAAVVAAKEKLSTWPDLKELEPWTTLNTKPAVSNDEWEPVEQARRRGYRLPRSRYQYRSPRFYRGPFHPHQPPKPSDPASREFIPGPFCLPRLEQTYHSTIAADLMTLSYTHFPHGYEAPPASPRLRSWDGSSPYHKNRPMRGPRGPSGILRPVRKPITFRNVPRLLGVTVHSQVRPSAGDTGALSVAGMALQAITNARCETHMVKHPVSDWGLKKGEVTSLTCDLYGEDAYHFLSKCVDLVLPKIKDYKGVKGSSGDESGNIQFGLRPEDVAFFPEIEVNYDMYPPQMIPGCHVIVKTSAASDKDARMLLMAFGVPFYGKFVDW